MKFLMYLIVGIIFFIFVAPVIVAAAAPVLCFVLASAFIVFIAKMTKG